jgi:hypothetical protein
MSTEPQQPRDAPVNPARRRAYSGSGSPLSRGLLRALDDVGRVCDDLQESRLSNLTEGGVWHDYRPARSDRVKAFLLRFRYSERAPYGQLRRAALPVIAVLFAAVALVLILR